MIVDVHAHLYHPSWYPARFNTYLGNDFARRKAAQTGRQVSASQIESVIRLMADRTGETTIRVMDAVGIEQRVILIVDWGLELGEPEISLEAIHREVLSVCRKSQGRLVGFAGVDPRRESGPDLLRIAFDELGARGLKLHPTGAWSLDDDRTGELVTLASSRGLPVLVHVGATMKILSDENSQPHALLRLARRFPSATFIAGHSGFELFRIFVDTPDVPANIYFDISGWQEMIRTQMELLPEYLSSLLRAFPGRVCFGTDSPFFSYNLAPQERWWIENVKNFAHDCSYDLRKAAQAVLDCPAALRTAISV
jgi:uncharacterized protein